MAHCGSVMISIFSKVDIFTDFELVFRLFCDVGVYKHTYARNMP